jgi:NADH:ubiquinone oxidoreductase subunit F (NADH-binding)/ferredoxin
MIPPAVPDTFCIGQPRLTAGLDRLRRIDRAGYQTVFGQVPRLTAEQLISMAEQVDLRGRGGAAFPVARKLSSVLDAARARRRAPIVVVNGTEGEPGSGKDRMLLLRSPYLVLTGALATARALDARVILVGVADPLVARSVYEAAAAEPALDRLVRVVEVPDRFVSGESGALVNAMNGRAALPPGRKSHASYNGVGTVLLTVGGAAERPAVVEVPSGLPLGEVLDLCGARPDGGVLVGGYHGSWVAAELAYDLPVSRAGLAAAGGTLGAGVVLAMGQGSCPVGEVTRVAAYLAKESSGQCGPCKLGLPSIARSLASLADGSGGVEMLDAVRRSASAVRGRGSCAHPDGVFRFVMSAVDVFSDDLATHFFRGSCGRPVSNVLPLPSPPGETQLTVDWTRCQGHGLCGHIVPELVQLDRQGFPQMLDMPVPRWLERGARQAVEMCPALALRLIPANPAPAAEPPRRGKPGRALRADPGQVADTVIDLVVSEEWIAEISAVRRPAPG